jgi:hypothetical protein
MKAFPIPEIRMMLFSFGSAEANHMHAYSQLLDTVGMPEVEYQAFGEFAADEGEARVSVRRSLEGWAIASARRSRSSRSTSPSSRRSARGCSYSPRSRSCCRSSAAT